MVRWFLALSLCLVALPANADPLDRVVAVVDNQLVLDSEVRLEAELAELDDTASPFWRAGRDPVERLIDAAAIRVAAGQVVLYQPPDEDVRLRREAVRARFEDRRSWKAFLDKHGLDEDSLLVVLRRRMIVERFLARNVQISPDDRTGWYRAAEELSTAIRDRTRVRTIPAERR